nr:hypothetical protein [Clostridium sp. C2-6-12]
MIIVNCALKQEDIIKIVENIEIESKKVFKYNKRDGIRIFFECDYNDIEKACNIVKKEIFKTKLGKALFYNVVDVKEYPWIK